MAMSMSVPIFELLCEVLNVARKASGIARLIRDERSGMFQKLVEEKTGDSKNSRFAQDYKTLADVIIQETIRKDLGEKFPPILEHILGEESNKFTNSLGERITVSVKATREETRDHFETLLAGNRKLASKLADVIHAEDVSESGAAASNPASSSRLPFPFRDDVLPYATRLSSPIPLQSLGIWIDPIDSTGEYIKGVDGAKFRHPGSGVVVKGLQTAVVLVGIFDRVTGEPVMGVIYQPFGEKLEMKPGLDAGDADATPRAEECDVTGALSTTQDSNDVDLVSAASGDPDAAGIDLGKPTSDGNCHSNGAPTSCWQERYAWGVCYGDIKVHSSGGVPLSATASSPHSSFSFHSLRGGNGSKGSQDFSSTSSPVPSSSLMNNHSYHSTNQPGEENSNKYNSSGQISAPSAASGSLNTASLGGVGVNSKVLLISGSEDSRDSSLLLPFRKEFNIVRAAGAGYKLLCLCDDLAQAYLLTKPTTYRWDTCAPHAILKAKGGNVYNWQKMTERCRQFAASGAPGGSKELLREIVEHGGNAYELKYHLEETGEFGAQRFKNSGGVLAVSYSNGLSSILRPLLETSRCQSELSHASHRMRSQSQLSSQSQKSNATRSSHQNLLHQQQQQQRSQSQLSQLSRPPSDRRSQSRQSQISPPLLNSLTSPLSGTSSSSSIIDGLVKKNFVEDVVASKSEFVAKQLDVMIDMGELLLPEGVEMSSSASSAGGIVVGESNNEEKETSLILSKDRGTPSRV